MMESPDGRILRPTDPDSLVLEAWGQGLMVCSLVVMTAVIGANMKRRILLHKLILIEASRSPPGLLLAIPHGTFIFQKPPVYGWYLFVSAVGLNVSWSLHSVIAWMKSKPFYSRNVSMAYIASVVVVQPYWLLEIYANFAYFNNINRVFEVTRPMEPFFRDPWWIITTCSLFYTIKRGYNFGIVELVTVSPRFGIMLAAMCVSILFIIIDTCSVIGVIRSAALPIGLSFIFKCLCNTVILDDFRTALDRIHTYHEERVRASAYPAIRDIRPLANAHQRPYNANSACAPTSAEVGEIVIEVSRRAGHIA
ncbi:hypothetical protein HCH54_005135 [Aspergillus fumigatus]